MCNAAECVKRLQAAVDELRVEGIPPVFIVAALAEIAVSTAKLDPAHADAQLQALLSVAAQTGARSPDAILGQRS